VLDPGVRAGTIPLTSDAGVAALSAMASAAGWWPAVTITEIVQKAPRIDSVLEANDRVVRVPHDDHIAGRVPRAPLLDPEIVDVMEVYIGKSSA
jgi:hypothetical protein